MASVVVANQSDPHAHLLTFNLKKHFLIRSMDGWSWVDHVTVVIVLLSSIKVKRTMFQMIMMTMMMNECSRKVVEQEVMTTAHNRCKKEKKKKLIL